MKSIIFALILTISIGALSSYPTSTPSKNSENDDLFVSIFKGLPYMGGFNKEFNGVIDTGPRSDVKRWNFLDSVQEIIREFREDKTFHWPHIRPPTGPGLDGLWSKTSDKGNATSTVEVIDGHKVIVNETVYKKQHDFGESIYKVRVVNILPVDEPQDDTIRPITNNNNDDVETIDKSTIDPFAIVESVDDALNKGNDKTDGVTTTTESNINRREELEDHDEDDDDEDDDDLKNIDDHHIVKGSPESFDDYSNLADNEISNDVETIESFELKSNNDNKNMNKNKNKNENDDNDDIIRNFYYGEKYGSKYLNDEFDSSEFVDDLHYHKKIFDDKLNHAFIDAKDDESPITFKPINLSNDINVNRMFADQQPNYYNPDAELIDIGNFNHNNHNDNNNENNDNDNDNNNNDNNNNDNDNDNNNNKYSNWNNAAAFDDDDIDYNQSDSETENPVDEFKTY